MTSSTSAPALRGLRDRLAGMSGPPFRARLSQLCAAAALKLVADEFRGSHAPDGARWVPLKSRHGKPLLNTGRLRASFATVPTADGFRIWTTVTYAGYHQFGTGTYAGRAARQVPARSAKQNARGRFVRMDRTGYLLRIRAHENRGIPARPMVPTGGVLPPPWRAAMEREIAGAVRRQLQGAA